MIGKLTDEQIEKCKRKMLGCIGCNDSKIAYVVPVNYVYDGQFIIAHSVLGIKIPMKRKNPDVFLK